MERWQKVSLILCVFGLLKELRPSEPFITEYIIHYKNVTAQEVIHVAFPVSTYASLVSLVVILFVTDLLRYRLIVMFEALMFMMTWIVLVWGNELNAIIMVEIFYGIACSADIAYSTYIYAQVERENYAKVTSHTSSANYAGKFIGGILAQILVTFKLMNYHELTILTLTFSILGFIATLFLPKVKTSMYFHRSISISKEEDEEKASNFSAVQMIWSDFKIAYAKSYILKWSVWWALASAGQYQVVNYIQALWEKINEEDNLEPYNGVIKTLHTFLSFLLCLGVGYVKPGLRRWGESLLGIISLAQGGLLAWMAISTNLYIAYFCYTLFRTIHPVMLTIASFEVAQGIPNDSHGLIFGINTFLALFLQTILTITVSDKRGLALDVQHQFLIYGAYFLVLGSIFVFVSAYSSSYSFYRQKIKKEKEDNEGENGKVCKEILPLNQVYTQVPTNDVEVM